MPADQRGRRRDIDGGSGAPDAGPREACGVFGVWAPGEDVAKLTYFGLYALQHRGQESAGIAVGDGSKMVVYKDMGLVSQVFDESILASLVGHVAVGHCRYSTAGSSVWDNAQPTFRSTARGSLAVAHNGNLTNAAELSGRVVADPLNQRNGDHGGASSRVGHATSDTAVLAALLSQRPEPDLFAAARAVLPELVGAFSLVFADDATLYAARDPWGVRPLVLGRLERGWVVASETGALDIVGAAFVREVAPGELVAIGADGLRSERFAAPTPKGCLFEFVYLARPDTRISGRSVHATRVEVGRRLARECPADADLVIPVPESGTPAAIGYAEESGIPYGQGLVKNSYVGRTFIQPSQTLRQLGIRLKLNPLRDVVAGKRLVVVDDSIVRGNNQRALIRMLREAGAREIHVRVSSPPVRNPCFYGVDFASPAELIANNVDVAGICRSIGADSLGFVSLAGLIEATGVPAGALCRACFDGVYPIPLPPPELRGKHTLEQIARRRDADGLATAVAGGGAAAALDRP